MSVSSSDNQTGSVKSVRRWWALLYIPAWVVLAFALAQVAVYLLVQLLLVLHIPLANVDSTILQTGLSVLIYAISLLIAIGAPWWLRKRRISHQDLGYKHTLRWIDMLLAPAAFIVYGLLSAIILWVATQLLPTVNWQQAQQVGFSSLHARYEYILAFMTLVILAPVAEETLFRGYLFGKLLKKVPVWAAVLVTSLIFGGLHLGVTAPLQWNVAFDVFALSVVLCSLRLVTGTIWAGILLHMLKNGIAFYVLFVDPSVLRIIGG